MLRVPNRIRFPGQRRKEKTKKGREREGEIDTVIYIYIYQAINSENESTLLHRKNYLNALWAVCVLRFFKYDQRETRRTRLRVMHMRYVPEIHIYTHTAENLTHVYESFESNYYTYNYYTGRCFRGNRLRNSKKYVVILIDKNFEFLQRYLYICFT